jgi:hypothetical protein
MANTTIRVHGVAGRAIARAFYILAVAIFGMGLCTALPKFRDLRGATPWMFLAAAALGIVGWLASRALARRVEVRDGTLHVVGGEPIEIGKPRTLRRGQFSHTLSVPAVPNAVGVVGRALLDGEESITAWVAIEGKTAKPVVFMAHLGVIGDLGWPKGTPPASHAELYLGESEIRRLAHAVGDLI